MKYLYVTLFALYIPQLYAQRLTDMVNYPSTPQTAALFKTIAAPVSLYTGQPDISIPLYTISQDGVEIPVSFSFNTSGIMVNEEATPLGLGVQLSWGGSISRSANGSPDEWGFFTNTYKIGDLKQELPKNYNNTSSLTCFPYCSNSTSLSTLAQRIYMYNQANIYSDPFSSPPTTGDKDFRPDDFHYSFLGKSGLFKYNQFDGKFVTYPLDDILIQKTTSLFSIDKFELTDDQGVKVAFGDGAKEFVRKSSISGGYTQSWFVKNVTTIKNSTIEFSYVPNQYYKTVPNDSELRFPAALGNGQQGGGQESYLHYESLIKTITFESGKLDFIYVNDRTDLNNTDPNSGLPNAGQPAPRLSKIVLYNKNNQPVKTFQFYHSYFSATSSLPTVDKNRLRLDSLAVQDNADNTVERYVFEYHTNSALPTKRSHARDHWGYYNGANSNSQAIPSCHAPITFPSSFYGTSWSGYDNWHDYYMQTLTANRFVNSSYNKTFTIKKIKYPTGGEQEYVFEDNYVRWYEIFDKMKDISNDGYDFVNQRIMVQGSTLATSYPSPNNQSTTERTVFGNEFNVDDFNETVEGEPNIFVRTNYVRPEITLSQLNMWEYRIEIGLQRKNNGVFSNYSLLANISRTDQNLTNNPTILAKLPYLPNGQYRIYVKMITPPQYIMDQWLNSNNQVINYPHLTVAGLTYRKKNFADIKVGGLRIKEIIERDGATEYKTSYEYTTSDGFCSGRINNVPEYKENILFHVKLNDGSTNNVPGYRLNSEAVFPLLKTQGSNVGYINIIKKNTASGKVIKEEFTYAFTPSLQSGNMRQYFQETEPKAWQSGKLLSHRQYDNGTIITEDSYEYFGMANETDKGFVEEINTGLISSFPYQYAGINNIGEISTLKRPNLPFLYQNYGFYPNLYYFDNRADGGMIGSVSNFVVAYINPPLKIPYFRLYTGFDKLKSKTTVNYFTTGTITRVENYFYDGIVNNNLAVTRKETTFSTGEHTTTKLYYPQDLLGDPWMSDMITANRVGNPIKIESLRNGTKINEEKFVYAKDNTTANLLLPKNIYSAKFPNDLPDLANIGKLEKKLTYEIYDAKGNLVQYKPQGGISTTVIWSYNNTVPVAKIENATYSTIVSVLGGSSVLTAFCNSSPTDAAVNNFLNVLRTSSSLNNAMVTTYTYTPLIGVTSVTDPKGDVAYYEYDSFGRLNSVKDKNGNLLIENSYNYKP
ncbi:RHS repeat protein [Flavobacterium rhizosphaerae]|uniref:RHS repeat domain-containing protein n=1 Tax=Flavobacterium rhizosphaerae TaxID=3163298 RepID=A0ABW8Z016_9FLAO